MVWCGVVWCGVVCGAVWYMDKNFKLLINSPILEALSPEQCTLMMRLQPELRRPA